ncbi:MAG TPA: dethiobiotin synthase [Kofleriaceae bacterium]|nr:dethiobiotin synthase [Kofleriaceae bacterium]
MKGYFVTGTDTGVGKTFVGAALAKRARELGERVFGFKPIETGVPAQREGEDQVLLCDAAGGWQTGELRGVYRYRQPAAPRVAAEAERTKIDLDRIARVFREGLAATHPNGGTPTFAVTEGAGGWRVPITDTADTSTLAKAIGLPVLVVARAGLGTINHSLLTLEAIERDGCEIAALVLNVRHDDDRIFARSNEQEIRTRWPGRIVYFLEPTDLDPLIVGPS